MEFDCSIREIPKEETEEALSLVWRVFQEYEAPGCAEEGIDEFYKASMRMGICPGFAGMGRLFRKNWPGLLRQGTRGRISHSFLSRDNITDGGLENGCFRLSGRRTVLIKMTVNSSPYAVPIYRRLGFRDTGAEQVVNGLRFTPMVYEMR